MDAYKQIFERALDTITNVLTSMKKWTWNSLKCWSVT